MALNLVLRGYLFEILTCDYQKCLKLSNHIYVYAKQSNNPSINDALAGSYRRSITNRKSIASR